MRDIEIVEMTKIKKTSMLGLPVSGPSLLHLHLRPNILDLLTKSGVLWSCWQIKQINFI